MSAEQVQCWRCGGLMVEGVTRYVGSGRDATIVIENIPAGVCEQCGESGFSLAIAKVVERLLNDLPTPSRTDTVPVYDLSEQRFCTPA